MKKILVLGSVAIMATAGMLPLGNAALGQTGCSPPSALCNQQVKGPKQTSSGAESTAPETTAPQSAQTSTTQPEQATTAQPGEAGANQAGAGLSVASVQNPRDTLAAATVRDSSGQIVGQVQGVDMSPTGQAKSVVVALNTPATHGKNVVLPAAQLNYNPTDKGVTAELTRSEIEALPSAQNTASPIDRSDGGSVH